MFGKKSDDKPDMELFTIFDTKSGIYRDPVFGRNKFEILRELSNLMSDPAQARNQLILNAEDFQLFKCAEFSRTTGMVKGVNLEHVANLHDLKHSVARSSAHDAPVLSPVRTDGH